MSSFSSLSRTGPHRIIILAAGLPVMDIFMELNQLQCSPLLGCEANLVHQAWGKEGATDTPVQWDRGSGLTDETCLLQER
mmetsp:Transcript_1955/g.5175  ORF Transcript_1955/g.5175 Transcript_1955/m.5175 type:complete len:80 (-) Transcript_1955:641-880(-)